MSVFFIFIFFFFFNDTATTEIYTLSLHDALPISLCGCTVTIVSEDSPFCGQSGRVRRVFWRERSPWVVVRLCLGDRKSTRLNSSHSQISYAVFCLKKKKTHANQCYHPQETVQMHA